MQRTRIIKENKVEEKRNGRPFVLKTRTRNGRTYKERRYGKNLVCKKCSKEYFTNDTTIKKRKQLDYCQQCINTGNTHGRWQGGRLKREGYWRIWVPNHPNADQRGYVWEHRLVMEKYLGRYLTNKEIVHHKNRDRGDNRLKNLQLFKNKAEHMRFHMKEAWAALSDGD